MDITLPEIDDIEPIYFPKDEDVIGGVFEPISKNSEYFECLSGYFNSRFLIELASPLSYFFINPAAKAKFIVSPDLKGKDKAAILDAYENDQDMSDFIFSSRSDLQGTLEKNVLKSIQYLISTGQLDFRLAVMEKGMLHSKIWIFETPKGSVAVHGSGNATGAAFSDNFEQLAVNKEWDGVSSAKVVAKNKAKFIEFWDELRSDSLTIKLNDATKRKIIRDFGEDGSKSSRENLYNKLVSELEKLYKNKLTIPKGIRYKSGDFKHQGEAVEAWEKNGSKGVLEIATGGGKTITSLIAASKKLFSVKKALILISVPTKPLVDQWITDVVEFGIDPYISKAGTTSDIVQKINQLRRYHNSQSGHEVIILTHNALKNERVIKALNKYNEKIFLIADEVHNLAVNLFMDGDTGYFDFVIGLSATPEKQYDPDQSAKLFRLIGPVVYRFTLEEAIGKCLVPFCYQPVFVYLNDEEEEEWLELTERIRQLQFLSDSNDSSALDFLKIRRSAVVEGCASKVSRFKKHIEEIKDIKNTLVFCSAKNANQLSMVNECLSDLKITFHQVTGQETSSKATQGSIIKAFDEGLIEVLTSMKVLDEGFNIPQTERAYFLSATSTTRIWIQRLGRVLRKSKSTEKPYATVIDFVVLPATHKRLFGKLLKSELARVQWFSALCGNYNSKNGPAALVTQLIDYMED